MPDGESPTVVGGVLLDAKLRWRIEDDTTLGALVWHCGPGWRMASSGVLGGGVGPRSFVVNAQIPGDYRRRDPQNHLVGIAADAGAAGDGVGLLTAADVSRARWGTDGGVRALATVGLGRPTWAADSARLDEARLASDPLEDQRPGTINIIVALPGALSDSALVNAVTTATEAKVQAVMGAGYACTGTASDAVCVATRTVADGLPEEAFGGPRSKWGARIARAVHTAVRAGALHDIDRCGELRRAPTGPT